MCRPQDRRERDAAALTAREYKPSETHDWKPAQKRPTDECNNHKLFRVDCVEHRDIYPEEQIYHLC